MHPSFECGRRPVGVTMTANKKNRAVFLDRDGTINRDVGYPRSWSSIEIYDYSYEAVRTLNMAGFLVVVVTNQSGVGRGLITERQVRRIHEKMREEFRAQDVRIDGFYYCPHHSHSLDLRYRMDCDCRKPHPEMGRRAAADLNIDTSRSYMIGDKAEDILFGQNIGAQPILVLTGYGRDSRARLKEKKARAAYVAEDLLRAVEWILSQEEISIK